MELGNGVIIQRGSLLAVYGPHVALTAIFCAPSHDLGISQCVKGKPMLLRIIFSKLKGKQSQKNVFTKHSFVDVDL